MVISCIICIEFVIAYIWSWRLTGTVIIDVFKKRRYIFTICKLLINNVVQQSMNPTFDKGYKFSSQNKLLHLLLWLFSELRRQPHLLRKLYNVFEIQDRAFIFDCKL